MTQTTPSSDHTRTLKSGNAQPSDQHKASIASPQEEKKLEPANDPGPEDE